MKYLFLVLLPFLFGCQSQAKNSDPIPEHQTFQIESQEVNETRVINVWVPEEYTNSTEKFPVLYMPDGGIQEDFPHIANTLKELIEAKKIRPFILVGIENTVRRRDLTPPTTVAKDKEVAPVVGESAKFRAFIEKELMPKINSDYRTTEETGIIGESLAGLFIMETFFLQPELFDHYIAMDPSIWWNNQNLVKEAKTRLADFPEGNKTLWFAGSKAKDINKHTKSLEEAFKTSAPENLNWMYSNEPKEEHHTIYRATKEKALIWSLK
jgi:predicted alpha/beta superfamily hydrolase